jgi:hypothetical protein
VWGDQAYRGQRAVIRQRAPKARDFEVDPGRETAGAAF